MKLLPLCLLMLTSASWGKTIHFDEFATFTPIPVNGLYIQGVLLNFAEGDAIFNQQVGTQGTAIFAVDPVLSGPATGILNLTFDQATPLLQFDILLQSIFALDDTDFGPNGGPAYTVLLSNGRTLTGGAAPQPDGLYSEGRFTYSGDPINSASISFFNGFDAGGMQVSSFALDNLTFGAPEPATFFVLGGGLLAIGLLKRRR